MRNEPAVEVYKWMLLEIKRQQKIEHQLLEQQHNRESLQSLEGLV